MRKLQMAKVLNSGMMEGSLGGLGIQLLAYFRKNMYEDDEREIIESMRKGKLYVKESGGVCTCVERWRCRDGFLCAPLVRKIATLLPQISPHKLLYH